MPSLERSKPFIASKETDSRVVILGASYDQSTSFRPGTRFGASSIREASYGLEEFDFWGGKSLVDAEYSDIGDIPVYGSMEGAMTAIKETISGLLRQGKVPITLGGEHSITFPIIDAVKDFHKDFHMVVFDAHADMRDGYCGIKYSHAAVMRRISEIIPGKRMHQFGIRSGSREEAEYYRESGVSVQFDPPDQGFFEGLKGKPVYVSIDIDVVDPAFAPGTGTPEPCGWTPVQLINTLKGLKGSKLIGLDLVEVSPPFDPSGITSVLAARLIREVLLTLI